MLRTTLFCVGVCLLGLGAAEGAPQGYSTQNSSTTGSNNVSGSDTTAGFERGFVGSLGQGRRPFPHVLNPYRQRTLPNPVLVNSPRLHSLIRDGKLQLSLSDALALTLENNLDIAVQRYVIPFAQTDILRTKSGQA